MFKKYLKFLVIIVIMMFGIFELVGCSNFSFEEYKLKAKEDITSYVKESNYTSDNWNIINNIINEGKIVIDKAENKINLDKLIITIKEMLDEVIKGAESSNIIKNGVYFITDASWELYVRSWTVDIEELVDDINEEWIQSAIDGTLRVIDKTGLYLRTPYRKVMNVVIYDDKMSVGDDVYYFNNDNNSYIGQKLNSTISFTLLDDILSINQRGIIKQYKLDDSYQLTQSIVEQYSKPTDIVYNSGLNDANFYWCPNAESGWFGTGIEIKTANSEEFKLIKIEYVYENSFEIQFYDVELTEGINILRIYYIGGPSFNRNTKQIFNIPNSEYTIYNLIVDADGYVTIQ